MSESLLWSDTAPAPTSPALLTRNAIRRRAIEAVIWGMPVVNFELMYRQMVHKTDGAFNQMLIWPGLLDWKNQTLTPNPDVIYLMCFFDTAAGPVVLEIPPADDGVLNGSIMNRWQAAIEDIGPGGLDKGAGGRYAMLPPGYDMAKVPAGLIAMPSDCRLGYALIRSVLKSGSAQDVAKAVAYARRIKLYPLAEKCDPPPTTYVDASAVVFDATIPYDLRFFESLHRMVQAEPWLERDKAMIDPLKTIGIERGKPFNPDGATRRILNEAIEEARSWLDLQYENMPPFYPDGHWFFPASRENIENVQSFWQTPDSYPTDNRGMVYAIAFFSAKHLGQAQYYLMSIADRNGAPLDGDALYRLHVPAGAPVTQYWSLTVYDRRTHAFIREAARMGRSSQSPDLAWNPDGSADIYFGPTAPAERRANWIPTDPDGGFEVLARFYGPQKALFDKSWRLADLERLPHGAR
jgi:hypothetical protein